MYGELFGLTTAWSWSISNIYTKQLTYRLNPIRIVIAYALIYTLLALVVAFFMGRLGGIFKLPFYDVAYLTLGATLVFAGNFTVFRAYSIGGGVGYTVTVLTSVFIFTTAIVGTIFLNESMSALQISGGVMIIIGIFIAYIKLSISSLTIKTISLNSLKGSAFTFAILTGFLWSLSLIFCTQGLTETDPITGAAISGVIPNCVFILACIFNSNIRPFPVERKYARKVFMGGLLYGVGLITAMASLDWAGVGLTAILISSTPVFSIPLGIWLLKERHSKQGMAGLIIAIIGIIIVVA